MDGPGNELFARPALTFDQHGKRHLCHAPYRIADGADGRAHTHDLRHVCARRRIKDGRPATQDRRNDESGGLEEQAHAPRLEIGPG
jgi:hypothetical protein